MKFDIAQADGRLYLTLSHPEVTRKFMGCVEDLAKSELFSSNYEEARDLLDFYLALKAALKEMEEKHDSL